MSSPYPVERTPNHLLSARSTDIACRLHQLGTVLPRGPSGCSQTPAHIGTYALPHVPEGNAARGPPRRRSRRRLAPHATTPNPGHVPCGFSVRGSANGPAIKARRVDERSIYMIGWNRHHDVPKTDERVLSQHRTPVTSPKGGKGIRGSANGLAPSSAEKGGCSATRHTTGSQLG